MHDLHEEQTNINTAGDNMLLTRQSLHIAALPGVAWLFIAIMEVRFRAMGYGPHFGPPEMEKLFFQVSFVWGTLLCVVSIALVGNSWFKRRFDFLSVLVVCAALAFLFSWYPAVGLEGLQQQLFPHGAH